MQLALDLPPAKTKLRHGGARPGAGRPARKHVGQVGHIGYVDITTSGESFDGWTEPVTMFRALGDDREPWTSVRASTWLARVGWRKRGLISPFAVPAHGAPA